MKSMDEVIAATFPTVLVPRSAPLVPAAKAGVRYLVAGDGLWREVSLPWIRVVHMIAPSSLQLPYGRLQEEVKLACPPIPAELRSQFLRDARQALPHEMAAALVWDSVTGLWRYEQRASVSSDAASVRYREVHLRDGEYLVVDLHSHAAYPAFFSSTDDEDDAGSMKFSGVLGDLDKGGISARMRLNMAGKTWVANLTATGHLEVFNDEAQVAG